MAIRADEILGTLLRRNQNLIDWVNSREKEITEGLKTARRAETSDSFTISVRTLALEGAADPNHLGYTFAATAAHDLVLRLRALGWDEADVDLAEGTVTVKRFRRRVLVAIKGIAAEISAPVYERESYDQAVSRILTKGVKAAEYGGHEPGLLCFNPVVIQCVRVPIYHTVN
jgi:hypothetical protein